jgi:predicted ATPase with chaperone activity
MPRKSAVHKIAKGQNTLCSGFLTITLSGPQGCGKSLVAKLLSVILPLTPLSEYRIVEKDEDLSVAGKLASTMARRNG